MKKIINPCKCEVYSALQKTANAFAEINFENGKLSIHGVVGPMSNGNCRGSCGQCVDEIRKGTPTDDWTDDMLQKFCDIWDKYHLNDMRPYCEHQKQLGWDKLAKKEVTIYHFKLRSEVIRKQQSIKDDAFEELKKGHTVKLSVQDRIILNLPYEIKSDMEMLSGDQYDYYEPRKPLYAGDRGATETKMLGWLYPKDHPEGLLAKPCPVCGYKYGTAWKTEEVSQEVIDWLFVLPDTKVQPAWV